MKIYTNTFDLKQPTEKKFWVAPYSDFKIGIKVLGYNGTDIPYPPKNIELYKDGTKLTVDSNDGNMAYWKIKSEGTGEVEYTVKAKRNNKVVGELKLIQSVTDSTVYEQESGGEIPSDLEVDSIEVGSEITFKNNPTQKITANGCAYLFNVESDGASIDNLSVDNVTVNNNVTVTNDADVKILRANYLYTIIEGCAGCYTAFIDGCTGKGTFKSIKVDEFVNIQNDFITIESQMDPGLTVIGGCGAMPHISVYDKTNDQRVYITPEEASQYHNKTFTFKPYFMQELNGGCGGYVLAAFN